MLKVVPVAAESFGARSLCTYVETEDVRILIDPGVSLGLRYFSLPHPIEYRAIRSLRKRLLEFAKKADAIVVSHYHFDHYTPNFTDYVWTYATEENFQAIYSDKVVFHKSIERRINASQRKRGYHFLKHVKEIACKVEEADERAFRFGDTRLRFLGPVPHGPSNTKLGWVLVTVIEREGEKFMHTSDVQGPMSTEALKLILKERPNIAVVCGPPFYLQDRAFLREELLEAVKNLESVVNVVNTVVIDHHLLRSSNWRELISSAFDRAAKRGSKIASMAEYAGRKELLLEDLRKTLYEDIPPSEEFEKWAKLPKEERRKTEPPV